MLYHVMGKTRYLLWWIFSDLFLIYRTFFLRGGSGLSETYVSVICAYIENIV